MILVDKNCKNETPELNIIANSYFDPGNAMMK